MSPKNNSNGTPSPRAKRAARDVGADRSDNSRDRIIEKLGPKRESEPKPAKPDTLANARRTGKSLAGKYGIQAEHVLYRQTGDWFHLPERFPAALLDERGYIKFSTPEEYDAFVQSGRDTGIKQSRETNTLTIKGGIASHHLYVPFSVAIFPDEITDPQTVIERARRQITVNSYERDSSARKLCIEEWGVDCVVCGLNFERTYGQIGMGFIHVHHLKPISSIKMEYVLTPQSDMRPVCPNCHAMLHRQEPPLSIDELRSIIGLIRKP